MFKNSADKLSRSSSFYIPPPEQTYYDSEKRVKELSTFPVVKEAPSKTGEFIPEKVEPTPSDAKKLVCTLCKKFLSVPPIFSSGELNKCGRCLGMPSNQTWHRNNLYEVTAVYLSFPCSESGKCREKLSFGNVLDHEKKCVYRKVRCPVKDCGQFVVWKRFKEHFRTNHLAEEYLVEDNQGLSPDIWTPAVFSTRKRDIFYCGSLNSEDLEFFVYTCSAKSHLLSLCFSSSTGTIEFNMHGSAPYEHGNLTPKATLTIQKQALFNLLEISDLSMCNKIELKLGDNARALLESHLNQDSSAIKEDLKTTIRNLYTCRLCNNVMVSKTKQCKRGHSSCFSHHNDYCNCSALFIPAEQNFVFENVQEISRRYFEEFAYKSAKLQRSLTRKHKPLSLAFEELRCLHCKRYLSVAPIFTSEDTKKAQCGRCIDIEVDDTLRHNESFEVKLSRLTFPCSESVKCNAVVAWGEAEMHEKTCPYRMMACPDSKCGGKFEIGNLAEHFRKAHQCYTYFPAGIILMVDSNEHRAALINFGSKEFLAYYTISEQSVCFNVRSLSVFDAHCVFSLQLTSKMSTISFKKYNFVLPYDDNSVKNGGVEVDRVVLREALGLTAQDTSFVMQINIFDYYPDLFQSISKELECSVCYEVMDSHIEICSSGHSICAQCKAKIKNCPMCHSDTFPNRNFALETTYICFQQYFQIMTNVNI